MRKVLGMALFTLLLAGFLAWQAGESFLTTYNLKNLARLIAFLSILAIGEAIVIICGGIDLSVGSIVGYSAMLVVYLIGTRGVPAPLAAALTLGLGTFVGLAQGLMITRLRLQPFIVTLGGMMTLRGLAQVLNSGGAVGIGPGHGGFQAVGGGFVLGIVPGPAVVLAGVLLAGGVMMHATVAGRYVYAIGANEEAARFSGISVDRYKTLAFTLCGALAGLTGVLYAGYLSSVQPSFGGAMELHAIAAAVLGGCSLRGGEGTILGVLVGATLMRLITNGINLLGISTYWEYVIVGGVILLAAVLDVAVQRRTEGQSPPAA